jgi:hypothetical protein
MTLQSSGSISMNDINSEFSRGRDLNSYRGTTWYKDDYTSGSFGSGSISMSEFYSKRSTSAIPPKFTKTITTNQQELDLRTWAINNGWDGSSAAEITVDAGVYIWSDSTNNPALTIYGGWPGGVTLTNNGYIMGKGGNGGLSTRGTTGGTGSGYSGGSAISLGVNVTIVNNSYIGGGGGGGGPEYYSGCAGGGAGGGVGSLNMFTLAAGGAGGSIGNYGSDGSVNRETSDVDGAIYYSYYYGGGGGGRIFPGTGGYYGSGNMTSLLNVSTPPIAGYARGGGAGGGGSCNGGGTSHGGSGGDSNNSGGTYVGQGGGGGGGWGASGGAGRDGAGGAGGKAIQLNGYTATRSGTGSTYGAVS